MLGNKPEKVEENYPEKVVENYKEYLKRYISEPSIYNALQDNAFQDIYDVTELRNAPLLTSLFLVAVIDFLSYMNNVPQESFYRLNIKEIKIPYNIKYIEPEAFSNCEYLEHIILPKSLEEIGDSAFKNCISLKEINIPDSVISIGDDAFRHTAIEEIKLPKLNSIGVDCFSLCENLKRIYFNMTKEEVADITNGKPDFIYLYLALNKDVELIFKG